MSKDMIDDLFIYPLLILNYILLFVNYNWCIYNKGNYKVCTYISTHFIIQS